MTARWRRGSPNWATPRLRSRIMTNCFRRAVFRGMKPSMLHCGIQRSVARVRRLLFARSTAARSAGRTSVVDDAPAQRIVRSAVIANVRSALASDAGKSHSHDFPATAGASPNSIVFAANSSCRETCTAGLRRGDRPCGSSSISRPSHRSAPWGWLPMWCLRRKTTIRMPDADVAAAAGDPDATLSYF